MLAGIHPDDASPGRVATGQSAAGPTRLADRAPRSVRRRGRLAISAHPHRQVSPRGVRSGRRPRRRPAPHRHGAGRVRLPAGLGQLLPARRQATAARVDSAARAVGQRRGPQLDGLGDRPRARQQPRGPAVRRRSAPTPSPCSPTWSRSTTPAGGNRCRCRSRPRSRGARRAGPTTTRSRPGAAGGAREATTARTPTPRTSGSGAPTHRSNAAAGADRVPVRNAPGEPTRLGAYAARRLGTDARFEQGAP